MKMFPTATSGNLSTRSRDGSELSGLAGGGRQTTECNYSLGHSLSLSAAPLQAGIHRHQSTATDPKG